MRNILAFYSTLILLLCMLFNPATATVSDGFLDTFIDIYKNSPSALQRYQPQLARATTPQIDRVISSLNLDNYTYLAPAVITARELPIAHQLPINELSLMAVRNGKLVDIPFQIDEFDTDGFIWIDGINKEKAEGKPGYFDGFDELVVMFRDAGEDTFTGTNNKIITEITLTAPNQQRRYVYLVRQPAPESDFQYVYTDLDKGVLRSTVYEVGFNPKNLLDMHTMLPKMGPQTDLNLLEDIQIHLSTGLLSRNLRFNLQLPNNIRVLPLAVKEGPVRNTIFLRIRVWYLGIPTLLTQHMQVHIYEQGTAIPIPFNISSIASLRHFIGLLKEPKLELHVKVNHLEGATVAFENLYSQQGQSATVNGKPTSLKTALNQQRMPGDWLSVDSNQGWSALFTNGVPIHEGGLFDHYLAGTKIKMVYEEPNSNTLKLGFEGKNLPDIIFELLKTAPKLPRKTTELGAALVFYEEAGKKGALEKYDDVVNRVVDTFTQDKQTLINSFLRDMGRMDYTGMDKEALHNILAASLNNSIAIPQRPLDHGHILTAMLEEAQRQGEDLERLRFATIPMNLWFPHKLDGAPDTFFAKQKEGISVQWKAWQ